MFETFSEDTTLEIPLTREKSCYKEYKSVSIISIIKWNSPFNVRICGILFLCLLLFLNFLSVVRCPTLRGEFHLMNMKTVFGKFCFYNNHFSRGCMCKKRRFTYTTDVNIERRISLYDRNYVLRLVFFITTFFAGKWDLQGRVPTKSLEHPYML